MNKNTAAVAEYYRGNLAWLPSRTILLTKHGSQAYGTNTPTSDLDLKGVAIPPREYYTGYAKRFAQAEGKEPDIVIYEVQKFVRLAADCNPSIIEVLWTDPSDHVACTKAGQRLVDARELFLSRKAKHTFSGYAMSQLKRIRGHHRWLRSPPKAPPTRAEYGLPERTVIPKDQLAAAMSVIEKKLSRWNLTDMNGLDPAARIAIQNTMADMLAEMQVSLDDQWKGAARTVGYDENFIRLLDLERQYQGRLTDWQQFEGWKRSRNPERAVDEARHGFDTKHGMHLVRLMRMAREILATGKVIVKRPDREELLAIRNGAWTYEQLIEWAEREDAALGELYDTSPLPHAPDIDAIDALCADIVWEALAA
jgi:predicted nucleotidyltransferase